MPEVFLPRNSQTAILHAAHFRKVVNNVFFIHFIELGRYNYTLNILKFITYTFSPGAKGLKWRFFDHESEQAEFGLKLCAMS